MDMVDFRPVVMMPRPVVAIAKIGPAMTAVPVRPVMGTIMMRPWVPRIGSNIYRMTGVVMACAMDAGPMAAVPSFALCVRPCRSCKTDKNNGCR
jgi:hypothetical protein